jgi:hypothetical protein
MSPDRSRAGHSPLLDGAPSRGSIPASSAEAVGTRGMGPNSPGTHEGASGIGAWTVRGRTRWPSPSPPKRTPGTRDRHLREGEGAGPPPSWGTQDGRDRLRAPPSPLAADRLVPWRRRLRVRPMPGLRPNAADPMNPPVAPPAEQKHPPELAFEFALRLEELHAESLRGSDEPRFISRICLVRLVHDAVGVPSAVGDSLETARSRVLVAVGRIPGPSPGVTPQRCEVGSTRYRSAPGESSCRERESATATTRPMCTRAAHRSGQSSPERRLPTRPGPPPREPASRMAGR